MLLSLSIQPVIHRIIHRQSYRRYWQRPHQRETYTPVQTPDSLGLEDVASVGEEVVLEAHAIVESGHLSKVVTGLEARGYGSITVEEEVKVIGELKRLFFCNE